MKSRSGRAPAVALTSTSVPWSFRSTSNCSGGCATSTRPTAAAIGATCSGSGRLSRGCWISSPNSR